MQKCPTTDALQSISKIVAVLQTEAQARLVANINEEHLTVSERHEGRRPACCHHSCFLFSEDGSYTAFLSHFHHTCCHHRLKRDLGLQSHNLNLSGILLYRNTDFIIVYYAKILWQIA